MGPPYITEEVVFDEKEIRRCFLSTEEAIAEAVLERESGAYPGYPAEFVKRMTEAQRFRTHPRLQHGQRWRTWAGGLQPGAVA